MQEQKKISLKSRAICRGLNSTDLSQNELEVQIKRLKSAASQRHKP